MRLPVFNLKSLGLLYIHFLFDNTIQESCLHVHLVQLPFHLSCKSYNGSDRSVSGHRSECLFIVNAFLLGKATSDKSCFILLNTSISSMFYFEEPFDDTTSLLFDLGTISHTSFFIMDWYSSVMASAHSFF
jgi:hypothetical protein